MNFPHRFPVITLVEHPDYIALANT